MDVLAKPQVGLAPNWQTSALFLTNLRELLDNAHHLERPKRGGQKAVGPAHGAGPTVAVSDFRHSVRINDCNRPGPWDSCLDRRSLWARGAFAPATALRRYDRAGIRVRKPAGRHHRDPDCR